MGDVGRVGSKLVGHNATKHAAASQSGSGMACATDGVMSRSRSPVRRNSVDGSPEHDAGVRKGDASESLQEAVVVVFCLLG